jgi:hypothetical protein
MDTLNKCFFIFLLGTFGPAVHAANLKAPIGFTSANVLPNHIRNIQFMEVGTQVNDKFNNDGQVVGLGNSLNKSLKWNDLIENEANPVKRGDYVGYLNSNGISLDEKVGETSGVVNVATDAQVYALAFGLNDKNTIAIAVPVAKIQINTNASAIAGASLNKVAQDLANDGKLDDANELRTKYMNAIQRKLSDNNYKSLANEKSTKLGDIRIIGKHLVTTNDNLAFTFTEELLLPTGVKKDVNKLVDVPTSDGAYSVSIGTILDYKITSDFAASLSSKYTFQLPDTYEDRVPYKVDSKITPDIDSQIKRDRGDIGELALGLGYGVTDWLTPKVAAGIQYKNKDTFSGSKYASWRYEQLANDSTQNLVSYQLGLEASTVKLYKQQKFVAPLSATLSMSGISSGKNVNKDPLYTLNVSLFL